MMFAKILMKCQNMVLNLQANIFGLSRAKRKSRPNDEFQNRRSAKFEHVTLWFRENSASRLQEGNKSRLVFSFPKESVLQVKGDLPIKSVSVVNSKGNCCEGDAS